MYVPYCESSGGGDRACEAGRGPHRHVWRICMCGSQISSCAARVCPFLGQPAL